MSSCLVPTAFGNTPTDSTRVEKRRSQKRRTLPAAVCSVWRNLPSSGAAGIPADFPVSAIGGAKLSARRPSGALVSRRNSRSSVLEVRAAPVQLNQNSRHSPGHTPPAIRCEISQLSERLCKCAGLCWCVVGVLWDFQSSR
jgi:hypothetical protein